MANTPQTYEQVRRRGAARLEHAGCASAQTGARILLQAAAGVTASGLIAQGDDIVPRAIADKFGSFIDRRAGHEPVAYITGEKEFWSRVFKVDKNVLIPRPETEGVVEEALALIKDVKSPRILDVGTGSGAILISLLSERTDASGHGVDISNAALEIARGNSVLNGVDKRCTFSHSDFLNAVDKRFDLIVSNPPYIDGAAMGELAADLNYEPELALAGGVDGLAAYRAIVAGLPRVLDKRSAVVFEIGFDQGKPVSHFLNEAGLIDVRVLPDLAGHDRIVSGKLSM